MATPTIVTGIVKAATDLTGSNFLVVKSDGTSTEQIILQATDTGIDTVGVLINQPDAGELAHICFEGFTTAIAGAAVEPYDLLMVNASSKVIVATSGKAIIGQYIPNSNGGTSLRTCAADDEIRIYVFANKSSLHSAAP